MIKQYKKLLDSVNAGVQHYNVIFNTYNDNKLMPIWKVLVEPFDN